MFTNLIESQSHRREFKRRSSFFLITVAAYTLALCGAGIASVYAYDAQLEAQTSSLELLNWVPPVTPAAPKPTTEHPPTVRKPATSNAPVDPNIRIAERTANVPPTNDPRVVPTKVGVTGIGIPPSTGPIRLSDRNVDPPTATTGNSGNCISCSDASPAVVMTGKPPEPPVVKPPTTQHVTSVVLSGKATSLPQPMYPRIAKDAHVQGTVSIQILVSEEGKVLSAQVVSGNAMLITAAKDAAMRARFTPTMLNGQPVKIQGIINYNFTLQ